MKKYGYALLIALFVILSPFVVEAHVKWFTDIEPKKETIERILSPTFLVLAMISALLLAILSQVLPTIMQWKLSKTFEEKLIGLHPYTLKILKYGTALSLAVQVINGTLFAPEIEVHEPFVTTATWVVIALLLVPNHLFTKAAMLLLLGLFVFKISAYSLFHMLDYGFYIAIIIVLMLEKTKLQAVAFPFLYLGTGLSLCWVAVEKWVYPSMALDIVNKHHVPTFGFDAAMFVSLTAFIEFIVGYLLVVGILNRLLGLVVTLIFFSTTLLFGVTEIIGHLMIHIVLLTFIIEGVSFYKPPVQMHKTRLDQMIFVFLNFIFVLATFILIYYRFA